MCSPEVIEQVRGTVTRRGFVGMLGTVALAGGVGKLPGAEDLGEAKRHFKQIADLTHVVSPQFPVWPGNEQMTITTLVTVKANGFYANRVTFNEHTGTHMDAPAHFADGGTTAELLPADRFIAPLAVIDISDRAAHDEDAQVTVDDIRAWERRHGRLRSGAFVAMFSGWEARVGTPATFINKDASGTMHFPGFSPDAAEFLVSERDIVGIGVDTLSLDFGASTNFKTHLTVLPAGKYGLENLANLSTIHPARTTIVVGGPKHQGASGGPSRVFALD